MQDYEPRNWNWIVGGDVSRAWSSAVGGWVAQWPADRTTCILNEIELSEVLRRYGLKGPVASADDVRAFASKRMQTQFQARNAAHLEMIIANANREAIRLLRLGESNWTLEQAARAVFLEQADAWIESVRAKSNELEPNPPTDFDDPNRWPPYMS